MTVAAPTAGPATPNAFARLKSLPLWAWAIVAVAAFAALDTLGDPARLMKALGDSDDATRLVQVREFLAGAPWFDRTLTRFGADGDYVSHWSRLIDLGIASLIRVLGLFLAPDRAELAARFVWPLVLFVPMAAILASEARRRGGALAGWLALVIIAAGVTGTVEFLPGRIDHHNAMILGVGGGLVLLARSLADERMARWAGLALGLGTAVGLESLLLTGAGMAAAATLAVVTGRGLRAVTAAATVLALTLGAAFFATTAPSEWMTSYCDALSLNLVLLAACGAAGLRLVQEVGEGWDMRTRIACLAAAGTVGVMLYGVAEPACLRGPFGQQDPGIGPIWLKHVTEVQSVLWLLSRAPEIGLVFLATLLLGLGAAWHIAESDYDDAAWLSLFVLLVASVLACWQIKLVPYASLLAVVPLAVTVARLKGTDKLSPLAIRSAAMAVACQMTLAMILAPLAPVLRLAPSPAAEAWFTTVRRCISTAAVEPLAQLPRGLMFGDRDLGPFIAASTPHRVFAAPYHRLDRAIIDNDRIMFGTVKDARESLAEVGVSYVAICPGFTRALDGEPRADSLYKALQSGNVPAWLEPVRLKGAEIVKVWRVKAAE